MTYPNPTNLTGLASLGLYANQVTNGWFWSLILLSMFFVVFFALKQYTVQRAYATASFVTWLISALMFTIGWVSLDKFILCTFAGGLGIVGLIMSNRQAYM